MRILWVKAGGLVPPDTGGKIRSYNILRELARKHSVTFFSFYAAHPNDEHPNLNQLFEQSISIPLELPTAKSSRELLDYVRFLFSSDPYSLMKYNRPVVRQALKTVLKQKRFDVIVCDFLVAAPVIPWDCPCPKVLFTHNVEAMIWKRHWEVARNPLWKALSWREWKSMASAERRYLRRADRVLAVSEADRNSFLEFIEPSKLAIVPTGVDIDFFSPGVTEEIPESLVFTGSMDWMPNEDGIFFFVEEVLPLIRQKLPNLSLSVVGRKPSPRLEEMAARDQRIQLTGRVEDVRPYVATGAVCIVPLRIGGGTRLKIYEAMAMGKAVVSTTIGAEGLPVKHGENILIADTPEDFARQIVELLRDSVRRKHIGDAARKLVAENYTWASVAEGFANVLQSVSRNYSSGNSGQ